MSPPFLFLFLLLSLSLFEFPALSRCLFPLLSHSPSHRMSPPFPFLFLLLSLSLFEFPALPRCLFPLLPHFPSRLMFPLFPSLFLLSSSLILLPTPLRNFLCSPPLCLLLYPSAVLFPDTFPIVSLSLHLFFLIPQQFSSLIPHLTLCLFLTLSHFLTPCLFLTLSHFATHFAYFV